MGGSFCLLYLVHTIDIKLSLEHYTKVNMIYNILYKIVFSLYLSYLYVCFIDEQHSTIKRLPINVIQNARRQKSL